MKEFNKLEKRAVNLDKEKIYGDLDVQCREEINEDVVSDYSDKIKRGAKFPPISVFVDKKGKLWLADGWHRIKATRQAKKNEIVVQFYQGEKSDAVLFACGANQEHGLRRSNEDKRRAARRTLEICPDWSDGLIAEHCGVSVPFVGEIRNQVLNVKTSKEESTKKEKAKVVLPQRRIGRDGKSYTMPAPKAKPVAKDEGFSTDEEGQEIPEDMLPIWERRPEVSDLMLKISNVRTALRKSKDSGDALLAACHQDVLTWLDNTYIELKGCMPHAVCPVCGGADVKCKWCNRRAGFVSQIQWNEKLPRDVIEVAQKAVKKNARK